MKYTSKKNMPEKYAIYVGERIFEISQSTERKDEIVEILSGMYGSEKVKAVKLRKNSNLYKYS